MSRLVSELTGTDLALWVARATERTDVVLKPRHVIGVLEPQMVCELIDGRQWMPHVDWAQGGPLIEGHHISLHFDTYEWTGEIFKAGAVGRRVWRNYGPTPLIAAMRALVASVYSDTVPDEVAP